MRYVVQILLLLYLVGCEITAPDIRLDTTIPPNQEQLRRIVELRQLPLIPTQLYEGTYKWSSDGPSWDGTGSHQIIQFGNSLDGPPIRLALTELPHGAELLSVAVVWDGTDGHASDPVNIFLPYFAVYELDLHAEREVLGYKQDTVTVRSNYEESHTIQLLLDTGNGGHIIDRVYRYEMFFWGEAGPGFLPEGSFRSVLVEYTLP